MLIPADCRFSGEHSSLAGVVEVQSREKLSRPEERLHGGEDIRAGS
jgi:hypothetical protein